jgi:hypothetical protein
MSFSCVLLSGLTATQIIMGPLNSRELIHGEKKLKNTTQEDRTSIINISGENLYDDSYDL